MDKQAALAKIKVLEKRHEAEKAARILAEQVITRLQAIVDKLQTGPADRTGTHEGQAEMEPDGSAG